MALLSKPTTNVLERHANLLKELEELIKDEGKVATRLARRAEELQRERKAEVKQELLAKNSIEINVEQADNFAKYELSRRLDNLIKLHTRQRSSQVKREGNHIEFREKAQRFLRRNSTMRQEAQIQSDNELKLYRQRKLFTFYATICTLNRIVQGHLWKEFKSRSDAWKRRVRCLLAASKIQRATRRYQRRFLSYHEIYLNKIRCTLRHALTFAGHDAIFNQGPKIKQIISAFVKDASKIFVIRTFIYDFKHSARYVCRRARDFLLIRQARVEVLQRLFEREKMRIYQVLSAQPDEESMELAKKIMDIPKVIRNRVLIEYVGACRDAFSPKFDAWRREMLAIYESGLRDDRFGWRSPLTA